jgi:HEAT repeat protein
VHRRLLLRLPRAARLAALRLGGEPAVARALADTPDLLSSESWLECALATGAGAVRALRRALVAGRVAAGNWREGLPRPRAEADWLLDALADVRDGGAVDHARASLAARDARRLHTATGERIPAAAIAHPGLVERFDLLAPDLRPGAPSTEELRRLLADAEGPEAGMLALRLAARQDPGTADFFAGLRRTAGRRTDHGVLAAYGMLGQPGVANELLAALRARDVDPGRGFVQRRIAADGLGELGFKSNVRAIVTALEAEQRSFEGRPGAGLGVQYPVRANLLRALGEIGSPEGIDVLLASLGDSAGSAFGGFYLPAMDALVKLGPPAEAPLRAHGLASGEFAAANAVGVLLALGADVAEFRSHPAAIVRRIAATA